MSNSLRALTAFADAEQNSDLLRLESLLQRFNLFEAIGVVRQELRHSDLLACLLDPGQSHGLGSIFLRELLRAVQKTAEDDSTLATPGLDVLDLCGCYVLREWHHIDILIVDDVNRLAIIIENKIDTKESLGQLQRYLDEVRHHESYQGYQIIALYLTPEGDEPSINSYSAVSYTQVCQVLSHVLEKSRTKLGGDIVIVMEHYAQMLRRHIVGDSEVANLCRSIYRQHKQALDTIYEHIPDQQAQIGQFVKSLIEQQNELKAGGSGKDYITFSLIEWQNSRRHRVEFGETFRWIVFFKFANGIDSLSLDLMIAPGDTLEREKHLQMAQKHRFTGYASRLTGKYSRIASMKFLSASDYEKTQDEIEAIISEKWAEYLNDEFSRIVEAIRQEKWLWDLPENAL